MISASSTLASLGQMRSRYMPGSTSAPKAATRSFSARLRGGLWAWEKPTPEQGVEEIEFLPKGPPFAVGGIALGHLAEHPFVRQPHVPVVIDIDGPHNGLGVEVDRGVVSYINWVPGPDGETDELPAWGHWATDRSYFEVAAQPSVTLSVSLGAETFTTKCAGVFSSICFSAEP